MNSHRKIEITNIAIESIERWSDNEKENKEKLFRILELYESELKKLIIYDIIESEFEDALKTCAKCSKVYSGDICRCTQENETIKFK